MIILAVLSVGWYPNIVRIDGVYGPPRANATCAYPTAGIATLPVSALGISRFDRLAVVSGASAALNTMLPADTVTITASPEIARGFTISHRNQMVTTPVLLACTLAPARA
jgi:hypothetical protein